MSGLEPLGAITKPCCALRYAVWLWRIHLGRETDGERFTCAACGQPYRKDSRGGWDPVSPLEDIRDLEGHHER